MTELPSHLTRALIGLAESAEGLDLRGADLVGDHEVAATRDRIVATIRDYLIPRIDRPNAPLLVVFAGPTGAGKSTLVNSATGLDLTVAGALRPTTSKPMVLAREIEDGRRAAAESAADVIVGGAPILDHMTFVDTPDIDSTSTDHRVVAESFIDRADIVVFVVSASRYADDVPWEVLRRAVSRGATVVPVINRLGPGASGVVTDFASRLRGAGLEVAPVRVPEHHLTTGAQRVPGPAVRELKRRLFKVAKAQRDHQAEVVTRVLNSTFRQAEDLAARLERLGGDLETAADSMARAMSAGPSIEPDGDREWAAPPRRRKPLWLRKLAGGEDDWMGRVARSLGAELESRLRADIALHGGAVLDAGVGLSTVTARSPAMIDGAVDSWLRFVGRISEASGVPDVDLVSDILLGPGGHDEDSPYAQGRRDLEGRLVVVWQHVGTLLSDGWRAMAGDPDAADLSAHTAEVAAAYQFADA